MATETDIYYEFIDVTKTPIIVPPSLPQKLSKQNLRSPSDKHLPHLLLYPPVLFSSDGVTFELVGRHQSYQLQLENHITKILFCIYRSKVKLDEYLNRIKRRDSAIVELVVQVIARLASKATIYRHKAMGAKRLCPFCHDALMSDRGTPKPDTKGFIRVHCYNSKQGRCGFSLPLTLPEADRFKNYNFDIHDFLINVPDRTCPKCGSPLYLRVMLMPDGTTAYYECCKNKFNIITSCTHAIKLDGAPSWLIK